MEPVERHQPLISIKPILTISSAV